MNPASEGLPMTVGYFRLILRGFGDTPEARAALLDGTGVSEQDLLDPVGGISLFQQVRQIDNATRLFGAGWAVSRPQLWNLPAHGALGVAFVSAQRLGDSLAVLKRFGHVRSPWFRIALRREAKATRIDVGVTVDLAVEQWRPMMEIAFVAINAMIGGVLGRTPEEMTYQFACPKPAHADALSAILCGTVSYGARTNSLSLPKEWASIASAHADAPLHARAVAELEEVLARLEDSANLRAEAERLLRTMPAGRLDAPNVARALRVSRRTLARRLKESGATFREMLDNELKSRAARYLDAETMSRPEMAEKLGYRDPTSFSRACRRWFGAERAKP